MAKRQRIRSLIATDRLTADGGSVLRTKQGRWRIKRLFKFGSASLLLLVSAFLAYASIGLPFPGKVAATRGEATTIYARDGVTELYKIRGDRNRTAIPFDQMPQCIKDATVAIEDRSFYKHQGLDPRGLARAVLVNFERGYGSQGGSTITQQLVKNALLSPEQTITRKAKELILSLEIEQIYAKDDILRLYLNEIPYGNSAYGIQAASKTYFGIEAKDLSLAQCATLASIPRAPTFYSPYNNPDPARLQNRSKLVLEKMLEDKMITQAEHDAAKAEIEKGLQFAAVGSGDTIKAAHFVFYVQEELEKDPKYTQAVLQNSGLKVISTLDPPKQSAAEQAIEDARSRFAGYGASNAALTSIDPKTGQVVAMVGSVDFFDVAAQGNVNVATSQRQPGSSLKPLVYTSAFDKPKSDNDRLTFNPAALLWDVKTNFGGYSPNNYDGKFRGPVSARDALQQSLNIPAVKTLDLAGPSYSVEYMRDKLGLDLPKDVVDRCGLALVLGCGEVRLVDLVGAYSTLANEGKKEPVTSILEVRDRKGKVINKYADKGTQTIDKALAYQMSNVLSDDTARAPQFGRGSALTLPGREAAAKTGTTDSFRDAWTVGYTPQLVAGVWLGNNDNTPMNRVGGSLGAAPIWQEYMKKALQDQPNEKFTKPSGVKEIKVDKLTGLLPGKNTTATKTEVFTDKNAPADKSTASGLDPCKKDTAVGGLTSERPENPAWENPVQAFIKTRGISSGTTTETKNQDQSEECGPDVSIISPSNGDTVDGTIQIQARATSDNGVKSVEFSWDGAVIGSVSSPPFIVSYSIKNSSGQHTITAKATDGNDNSKSVSITVKVGSSSTISVTLSCDASRDCTATASDAIDSAVLVNADNPSQTVAMSGSGTSFSATAPASWNRTYAVGTDNDGNSIKSTTKILAAAGQLASIYDASWFL